MNARKRPPKYPGRRPPVTRQQAIYRDHSEMTPAERVEYFTQERECWDDLVMWHIKAELELPWALPTYVKPGVRND